MATNRSEWQKEKKNAPADTVGVSSSSSWGSSAARQCRTSTCSEKNSSSESWSWRVSAHEWSVASSRSSPVPTSVSAQLCIESTIESARVSSFSGSEWCPALPPTRRRSTAESTRVLERQTMLNKGRCGGPVVSVRAFYSDDLSSNPTDYCMKRQQ